MEELVRQNSGTKIVAIDIVIYGRVVGVLPSVASEKGREGNFGSAWSDRRLRFRAFALRYP